ncbi:Strongly-conserved Zn-finger binding protein (TFIIIA) [Geranomyces michiganensis]|nr:Strongly-conserved Zn-finger binding protein (TFIIIA) [Geranomyces michiganensis]
MPDLARLLLAPTLSHSACQPPLSACLPANRDGVQTALSRKRQLSSTELFAEGSGLAKRSRVQGLPTPATTPIPSPLSEEPAREGDDEQHNLEVGAAVHSGDSEDISGNDSDARSKPRPHKCTFPSCERTFTKSSKLRRHERTHGNERPFRCHLCPKTYVRNEHLIRHARTHATTPMGQRPFPCKHEGCTHAFASQYHLNRHAKTHVAPNPYPCTIGGCSESFAKHNQLRLHICTHTGSKPHACSLCPKSFPTAQKLKAHQRTHSIEPHYRCGHLDCDAPSFAKWTLLQQHMKEAHKPKCPQCHKTFSRRDTLKDHMQVHEEKRTVWVCEWEGCGKEFASAKSRTVHFRASHEHIIPFTCEHPGCDAAFAHKHLLVRHRRVHENKAACDTNGSTPRPRKKRSDAIPPPSLLEMITGFGYAAPATGRVLSCTVEGCKSMFRREYDLKRHVASAH